MKIRIGILKGDCPYGVNYHESWKDLGRCVTIWKYAEGGPNISGATLIPEKVLEDRFKKYFAKSNCAWFVPCNERMAVEEEFAKNRPNWPFIVQIKIHKFLGWALIIRWYD